MTVEKKRILFVMPLGEFYGGGERSGFEFCKFLEKHGYKVVTAIPKTSKTYKKSLEDSGMNYHLLDCTEHEARSMRNNPKFYDIVNQLVGIIKKDKIDLVITNLYAQTGPVAAILANIPNVSMDRGQSYINDEHSSFMAKFSDFIAVNSLGLVDIYREKYNIETPIIYSYTEKPKEGLNKGVVDQRIVCVSRIAPEKNIEDTLRAVKILKTEKVFDGKFLIIGPVMSQGYQDELVAYIKENDLEDNVEWMGDQTHPWSLVGKNDIYLNTSEKESVGRSSIEAIKLGLPTVLSDIPGHKDIFEEIGSLKCEYGNPTDLAEKIKSIINDPKAAKKKAERARVKAEGLINEFDCNKNILPLLESIGGESSVSAGGILEYMLSIDAENTKVIAEQAGSVSNLNGAIAGLDAEIVSYLGVKRSLRLLLGNVKRKVRIRTRITNALKWK